MEIINYDFNKHYESIINRIRDSFHPEKIILFGSYATGEPTEESDVDLLIVADTDLSVKDRFPAVSRLLGDFPAAFDVILTDTGGI